MPDQVRHDNAATFYETVIFGSYSKITVAAVAGYTTMYYFQFYFKFQSRYFLYKLSIPLIFIGSNGSSQNGKGDKI